MCFLANVGFRLLATTVTLFIILVTITIIAFILVKYT